MDFLIRCKLILLPLLFTACTTMIQKSGEFLEGQGAGETQMAYYKSLDSGNREIAKKVKIKEIIQRDLTYTLEITSDSWPGLVLRGGRPRGNGTFDLIEASILSSHVQGWNEFTLDLMGQGVFDNPKRIGGVLKMPGEVERVQISSGKIRLKSNRVTNDAALSALRNRRERVLAITEWMAEWLDNNGIAETFYSQKEFEKFWKPKLFPELVLKSKRPNDYHTENASWRRADSINWNRSYTEHAFPEELWEFRNSGAMLRDWEEALAWIYTEYFWDYIIASFNDVTLQNK